MEYDNRFIVWQLTDWNMNYDQRKILIWIKTMN